MPSPAASDAARLVFALRTVDPGADDVAVRVWVFVRANAALEVLDAVPRLVQIANEAVRSES